jgi:oligopeptide/dipeptide ABC transporter ATP-binding protein
MAENTAKEYLRVENLHTYFHTPEGVVRSVDGVSFHINEGETLALVGESGCGKTVTSLSLIHLLPDNAELFADKMIIDGHTIKKLTKEEARRLRGSQISMIFQEPMTSLNPVYRIEKQLGEVFRLHNPGISKKEVFERSVAILKKVGVPKPEERLKVYPHQLSGGLRQRVMIAISLASNPHMVIADEPTTALDVTIQAQIIDLLKSLQRDMNMSIMLITHDFGVVSQIAHRVAVMYAGKIVETGPLEDIFQDPWHVYTRLLIMSIPGIKVTRGGRLESIAGTVPNPLHWPKGCRFAPRCPEALDICFEEEPKPFVCGERTVCCHLKQR